VGSGAGIPVARPLRPVDRLAAKNVVRQLSFGHIDGLRRTLVAHAARVGLENKALPTPNSGEPTFIVTMTCAAVAPFLFEKRNGMPEDWQLFLVALFLVVLFVGAARMQRTYLEQLRNSA